MSVCFPRLGEFSAIISSDKFSSPFPRSTSGILIMQCYVHDVAQRSLNLFSLIFCFFFLALQCG